MDTEADIELFRASFPALKTLCEGDSNNDENLVRLSSMFNDVAAIVEHFDYKNVKMNGFRGILHFVANYVSICVNERPQDREHLLRVLVFIMKYSYDCYEVDENFNYRLAMKSDTYFEFLRESGMMLGDFKHILRPYAGRLFEKDVLPIHRSFMAAVMLAASPTYLDMFKQLVSPIHADLRAAQFALRSGTTIKGFLDILRVPDYWLAKSITSMIYKFTHGSISAKSVHLELESPFVLRVVTEPQVDVVLEQNRSKSTRSVRCRLYENTSVQKSIKKNLIFHVHGGGLTISSPESHEVYLMDYATKIPNAAILSVDYSLAPEAKFPVALQDVLDAYHWVTSGKQEVRDFLGFEPDKIVVTGDSAGACVLVSMVQVLADVRKTFREASNLPPLPRAIVLIYLSSVGFVMYPSKLIASLDLITSPSGLFELDVLTCPFQLDMQMASTLKYIPQEILQKLQKLHRHPYMSHLFYEDFEALKDVQLVLIETLTDTFVDVSVEVAKSWRGPVKLIPIKKQSHGFMQANGLCPSATVATQVVIDNLRECLED